MVYREPADELARREARTQTGPLLRLDVSGRPGPSGRPGGLGADGTGSGGDGARGGDAGEATPGERGGALDIELVADTRDGIALVRGTGVAVWQEQAPILHEIGFDRPGEVELVAVGGRGGDGGVGGAGGDGARGRAGSDATRYSSGGNGGPGGDGGDGGNGTSGERGGIGGDVRVRVDDRDTHLLMLVAHDVRGGQGGEAGRNGSGGPGGPGGRGGSSYSWTETETYTDSQGNLQTRSTSHSNPGGSNGRSGRPGNPGQAHLQDGRDGSHGNFSIEVTDRGAVKTRASSRYDVELVSFRHRNENDDGIYEPEERVFVSHVEIVNKGGMELPAHHDVIVRLRDDGWIGPTEGMKLTLPRALPAGASHVFAKEELELTLRVFRPQATGGPLAAPETVRLFAELPDVRRSFGAFTSDATEEMGRIVVRFPIELSPITSLYSLAPGQAARVKWSIANVSEKAFGVDSSVGRALGIKLTLEGSELLDEHVLFVDANGVRHSLVSGYVVPVPRLDAKYTASFEGTIAIAPDAPPYRSARLVVSAELGHIAAPTTVRPIQLQELTVRVGQPYDEKGADVLIVTNNRTMRDEVSAWQSLVRSLDLSSSVWDASLEGGMTVLREIAAGMRSYRLVILLNNTMDTAAGERRASVLVDKATVHGLARAGTQVLYVGRAPEMDTLAVPIGDADEAIEIQRWYHWPWSQPSELDLEARANEIVEALSKAFPDRRFVAVHRYDPSLVKKVATSRRMKLGTVEIRRSIDAAPGRVFDVEVDAKDMHRADFVSSDATFALAVHALPFTQKLALLDRSPAPFGDRARGAAGDSCQDVLVSGVLFDLVREQRALVRHGWRSGATPDQLAKWMPLLGELGGGFGDPIDLASARGQRFVELLAWLDLVARGHDRWFEWLPPLVWLRRGIMLRGVVRKALEALVEKTCADPKAAWAAIAERRKVLSKIRKEAYDRTMQFAVDRLESGLDDRKVGCDAELVPATRVLTGAEHDDIAKKETERNGRAQAVVSRAAEARAELLVKEGFMGLASRIAAPPAQVRIADAPAVIQEEEMATAEDLDALREVR